MSKYKPIDKSLKEIFIKASKGMGKEKDPSDPQSLTKEDLARWTGMSESTVDRYLNPSMKNASDLIAVMEVLYHRNMREKLTIFGERSSCQAGKLIKDYYSDFTSANQIIAPAPGVDASEREDVIRIINDHQTLIDSKLKTQFNWLIIAVISFLLVSNLVILNSAYEINDKLEDQGTMFRQMQDREAKK